MAESLSFGDPSQTAESALVTSLPVLIISVSETGTETSSETTDDAPITENPTIQRLPPVTVNVSVTAASISSDQVSPVSFFTGTTVLSSTVTLVSSFTNPSVSLVADSSVSSVSSVSSSTGTLTETTVSYTEATVSPFTAGSLSSSTETSVLFLSATSKSSVPESSDSIVSEASVSSVADSPDSFATETVSSSTVPLGPSFTASSVSSAATIVTAQNSSFTSTSPSESFDASLSSVSVTSSSALENSSNVSFSDSDIPDTSELPPIRARPPPGDLPLSFDVESSSVASSGGSGTSTDSQLSLSASGPQVSDSFINQGGSRLSTASAGAGGNSSGWFKTSGVSSFAGVSSVDLKSSQDRNHQSSSLTTGYDSDSGADSSHNSQSHVDFTSLTSLVGNGNVDRFGTAHFPSIPTISSVSGGRIGGGASDGDGTASDIVSRSSSVVGESDGRAIGVGQSFGTTTKVDSRDFSSETDTSLAVVGDLGGGLGDEDGSFDEWDSSSADTDVSRGSQGKDTGSDKGRYLSRDGGERGLGIDDRSGTFRVSSSSFASSVVSGQTADSSSPVVKPGATIASPSRETGSSGYSQTTSPYQANSGSTLNPRGVFWLCLVALFL